MQEGLSLQGSGRKEREISQGTARLFLFLPTSFIALGRPFRAGMAVSQGIGILSATHLFNLPPPPAA